MIIELLPEILLAERARVQVVCDNYQYCWSSLQYLFYKHERTKYTLSNLKKKLNVPEKMFPITLINVCFLNRHETRLVCSQNCLEARLISN